MAGRRADRLPPTIHLDRGDGTGARGGRPAPQPFVGLVSGADVPVLELDLPPSLTGMARERVARRRLTDMIGPEGARAELRPLPSAERGRPWRRALMAERDKLAGWRKAAAGHGQRCLALLPDYLALPAAPDVWVLEIGETLTVARLGPDDGFSAEHALARRMLAAALAKAAPKAVLRRGADVARYDDLFADKKIALAETPDDLQKAGAEWPRAFAHNELRLDLGRDLGAETARLIGAVRVWVTAAALAGLGLVLLAGSLWISAQAGRDLADAYRTEAAALTRQHFVPQGPILDIRRQVTAALDARQQAAAAAPGESDPLKRLRDALSIVTEAGAGLAAASFQPETGWVIDLETSDFAALEQIVTDLGASGLPARVAEARAEEAGGVAGTIILGRGGGQP